MGMCEVEEEEEEEEEEREEGSITARASTHCAGAETRVLDSVLSS